MNYKISGIDSIQTESIPDSLKALKNWVAWRAEPNGDKKPRKIPVDPRTAKNAKSNDPDTWGTFSEAMDCCRAKSLAGIGLMFAGENLVGVDLDNIMEDGQWTNPVAKNLVLSLDTYCEVSPSGHGVKLWLLSDVVAKSCNCTIKIERVKNGKTITESLDLETYHRGRWFAVTGHRISKTAEVEDRTDKYCKMMEMTGRITTYTDGVMTGTRPINQDAQITACKTDNKNKNQTDFIGKDIGLTDYDACKIWSALQVLDYNQEGNWTKYSMALKKWGAESGRPNDAHDLWQRWSAMSTDYDANLNGAENESRWDRYGSDGVGIGSLIYDARSQGWDGKPLNMDGSAWVNLISTKDDKANIILPNLGGDLGISIYECAHNVGKAYALGPLYNKSGVVVSVTPTGTNDMSPAAYMSELGSKCNLFTMRTIKAKKNKNGDIITPESTVPYQCNCTEAQARAILNAKNFIQELPPLNVISKCPILVSDDNGKTVRKELDYDRKSGILIAGGSAEDVELPDAVALLEDALSDYKFVSPSDKSRALAAFITPALVHAGLLHGRAPVDLSEADDSQTGKSYRAKIIAAIYGDTTYSITQRNGGVGGLDESYSNALILGKSMIVLENVRGKIDSQLIESSLTEDIVDARAPYRKPQVVDVRKITVMFTSNKAELTQDLANRTSPVRLLKRYGEPWKVYPNGLDLLTHIRRHQGLYLGAVFAIVKEWVRLGMPKTNESRHDFRAWAMSLDWIVKNIFHAEPLCDGIAEAKSAMTISSYGLIRDIAILIEKNQKLGEWLRTWELVRLASENEIAMPFLAADADLDDDIIMKNANQGFGRMISKIMNGNAKVENLSGYDLYIDTTLQDSHGKAIKRYAITKHNSPPIIPEPSKNIFENLN